MNVSHKIKKVLSFSIILLVAVSGTGCSLDAAISDLTQQSPPDEIAQRVDPDFTASEVVTTHEGVIVRGSFGEISEKQILANKVVIEGAFYE